jgi:serine/threonine-protein kinase
MPTASHCPACGRTVAPDDRFCPGCGTSLSAEPSADDADLEARLHDVLAPSYLLVRRLGGGGMGTVFLAREPALKRLVAVKVLSPRLAVDQTARQRFEREAQAAAGLSHPNVVSVYGVGALADGTPFFVMQYVEGESMAVRIAREGPLEPDEARRILGQVASALAAAHAKGVIHRDIKPANILYDAESGRVLVSDFGIAAVRPTAQVEAPATLTQTGMVIGTPQYMSPEQLLAEKVTEKTDIYSLGLLGYELLTGRGPFEASSPGELVAAHLRDRPEKLSALRADMDPELEGTLTACLAKEAVRRPGAQEIAQRLTPGAAALLEWPPPGLDSLMSRLPGVTRTLGTGSLLFAGSAVLLVALGTRLAPAHASLATLLLWLSGVAGTLLLILAGFHLVRLGRAASRAARAGFAWLTIIEVLADRRGDTGALIAGTREYAALEPAERNRIRRERFAARGTAALGAALPAPLFVLAAWLGAQGVGNPAVLPAVILVPSLLLALASRRLEIRETRALRAARDALAARRTRKVQAARLVGPWYESFEAARRGQELGAGPRGRTAAGWATAAAAALAVGAAALVTVPLVVVASVGPVLWLVVTPDVTSTRDKLRIAEGVRRYRLPPDRGISPERAGQAYHLLAREIRAGPLKSRPLPPPLPPWSDRADDPFGVAAGNLNQLSQDIWERARRGFTAGERRFLERFADHPAFTQVATLARAPVIDVLGAAFELPFPDDFQGLEVPTPPFEIKQAAYAQVVRAAWLHSRGRVAEADTAVREVISVGFLMLDESATLIEQLLGAVLVGIGRGGLEQLYRAEGRATEAAAIRSTVDSVYAIIQQLDVERESLGRRTMDVSALRRRLTRGLTDSTTLRWLRWEYLIMASLVPCTNLRELVFGPAPDVEAAVGRARADLVRFPSEAELFRVLVETPQRFRPELLGHRHLHRFAVGAARATGVLLGNDRLAGCIGMLLVGGLWF